MSSDSEHIDDVEATPSTGVSMGPTYFYSKKKRKVLQPLTSPIEGAASPVVVSNSEDDSDISSCDDSVLDPPYLPESASIGHDTETEIDEPVAGPSGIITKGRREYPSDSETSESESDGDAQRGVSENISDVGGDGDGDGHTVASEPSTVTSVPGTRPSEVTGRKKAHKPETWKQTVAKTKRNLGEEYVSVGSGAVIKKRTIGRPCNDGCFTKLGENVVQQIFDDYWKLGDWSAQNAYLLSVVRAVPIKRKRTKKDVSSRPCNYEYIVKHSGKQYSVCKRGFNAIHGLQEGRLRYLFKEKVTDTGMSIPDKRGKKTPPNRTPALALQRVHEHIKMLPVTQSHYTRAKSTKRVYLPSTTSIPRLYAKYLEFYRHKYAGDELKPVSDHLYRDVFTKHYNIGIAPPSKDTCTTCDMTNAEIQRTQAEGKDVSMLQRKLDAHKSKAGEAQELIRTLQNDPDPQRKVVCIDLQQTLPCPRLTTGIAYYKMKLWVYNFCIHDVKTGQSTMFVWEETVGGRGSEEVGSCWLKWLELMSGETFNTVTIIADNCAGQNKNIVLVLTALQQVHSGRLNRVELVFLVSGHSYMPCDRSFGLIEKRIRANETILTTAEYVDIIRATNKRFRVVEMKLDDFLDLKHLMTAVTIRRATQGKFSKASQLVITDTYKEGYLVKDHYRASDSVATNVRLQPGQKTFQRGDFHLETVTVGRKYMEERMLKQTKVNHLKSLLPFYVSQQSRAWLEGLIARQEQLAGAVQAHNEDQGLDDPECNTMDYVYDGTQAC